MEISIFLAKIFGLYMIIIGLAFILKHRIFVRMISDAIKNLHAVYFLIIGELLLGLLLVLHHNIWEADWRIIITIISWITLIEAFFYLILPHSVLMRVMHSLNTNAMYVFGGVLSIILGLYLAYIGFGFDFITFDLGTFGAAVENATASVINAGGSGLAKIIYGL